MKVNWLVAAIATIVTGLGLTLTAAAEGPADHVGSSDYYLGDSSVSTVANHQPSASDQQGVAPAAAPAVCVPAEEAPEEEECEQWHLFCQKECGANVYGFLDAGIMFNVDDPVDAYNGPVTFPDRDFGQFNQGYVIVEDVADNEGCGTDWGYRLDFLGGSDYVFTMAAGLELHQNFAPHWNQRAPGESSEYGIALPQFFVDVAYNDWKIKLGHFYTPIGYEVVPANGNFFYTHAYTMQYGEPFTHTGVLGAYKYSDTTTLNIGVVNGWDAFDKVNDEAAPIFGFAWDGGEGLTVAWNAIFSNEEPVPLGPAAGTLTNRALYSLVVGYTFGCDDEWQYVFQHDCGWQTGASAFTPGENAEWYGVNQYLFYTVNDCWKAGARFEWFRDDDGSRVTGLRNPGNAIFGQSFAGNFYECSLGMNWTPTANWIVRPELRYDWFDGVGTVAGPYNAGTQDSQFLLGFDAIFLW